MLYVLPNRIVERDFFGLESFKNLRAGAADPLGVRISRAPKLVYRIIGHRRNTLSLATG